MTAPAERPSADFLAEAAELLEELSRDLLRLDAAGPDPDPGLVHGLFRRAHSLKGLSAMFGREAMASLAHGVEDLLDELRLGRLRPDGAVLDVLLEATETLSRLLAEAGDDGAPAAGGAGEGVRGLLVRIELLAARRETAVGADPLDGLALPPAVRDALTEYEAHRLRENLRRGVPIRKVRAAFDLADFDRGLADLNVALGALGEVISTLPSAEPAEGIAFDLLVAATAELPVVAAAVGSLGATVEALGTAPAAPAPGPPAAPAAAAALALAPLADAGDALASPSGEAGEALVPARPVARTVRVDIRKLDGLMGVVGELGLLRSNLQRLADRVRTAGLEPSLVAELQRDGRALERRLDELQDGLLAMRMVPLGQVFDRLARLVRRASRDSGKELELVVEGADVELDKGIVEELSDPLMHLVRNAIDHGIERPEARAAAGKPRRGVLSLRASQRGSHAVIEIADDGAGLDEARIREVAAARGLLAPDELASLSRREVLGLVFEPGFSTARTVTELSGRGVGLDVVRTQVARLSGRLDVASEAGRGAAFTVTLPVTLAILPALLVGVEGRTFAVPLSSVLEIVRVRADEVHTLERREVIDLRGATLVYARLGRLFELEPPPPPPARQFAVVVGLAQERLVLAVDALLGQEDVVVKPLGTALGPVPGIAGATDLGGGRTVLVLDVAALLGEVLGGGRRREVP